MDASFVSCPAIKCTPSGALRLATSASRSVRDSTATPQADPHRDSGQDLSLCWLGTHQPETKACHAIEPFIVNRSHVGGLILRSATGRLPSRRALGNDNAVRMRFRTEADLRQLIAHRIPESTSLEYKRELTLDKQSERLEVLKDITGVANGGVSTIIYGMAESASGDWPVAEELRPMSDFGLIGKLENIWRDGVRPPLLADYTAIEVPRGFLLVVDLQPSPIGPYMVEAYGQRRYYTRQGTSTVPMTEQQVRDAYALALRSRERRPSVWSDHALPMSPPTPAPWVVISALPEEPLTEILDMRVVDPGDLQPPADIATYVNNLELGDLTPALRAMTRWVDGFHGLDDRRGEGPWRAVRVHRDGAAAIAMRVDAENGLLWPVYVARLVNAALLYLAWVWRRFPVTRPVEVRIDLHKAGGLALALDPGSSPPEVSRPIFAPPGLSVDPIFTIDYVLPWELSRASVRHQLLSRFADRLHQAAGEKASGPPFRRGLLYDSAGVCINVSIGTDALWNDAGNAHLAVLHGDGSIIRNSSGELAAWYRDGVVLDLAGDALAVLELAPGVGCPDAFIGTSLNRDPFGIAGRIARGPYAAPVQHDPPESTGRWSAGVLRDLLGP